VPLPFPPEPPHDTFDSVSLDTLYLRSSEKWRRHPPDVLPSFIAEMDLPVAPVVLDAIRSTLDNGGDLGYAHSFTSSSPLQQIFSSWAAVNFGWAVAPERVILFADVMRVVEAALSALTEPGDGVVVDVPAYPPYFTTIPDHGRKIVENPMIYRDGHWLPNLAGLESAFRNGASAYLLCNPHNPTGRVFSMGELLRIADLAATYRVLVISDEVHGPLTYPGHRHIPIATVPGASRLRLVTATSATKGWNIAGLKCGFGVPNSAETLQALTSMPARTRDGVGILGVIASAAALSAGGPWLGTVLRYLDKNRHLLADLLAEHLPDLAYAPPEGTYLAWLDARRVLDRCGVDEIGKLMLDRGRVAVSDGREFGMEGFVRINFATSTAILTEVVNRMALAVRC
jgi:cystathionine beta-lyase